MSALTSPDVPLSFSVAARLGAAVSHEDAADVWGIDVVRRPAELQVTVARSRSRCRASGVQVHRRDLADVDVVERGGVRVTSPLRTVLDLSRKLPLAEAVAAADSALRLRLLAYDELVQAVAALPPAIGRRQCREVLALVDPSSGSVLESLLRLLLEQAGLRPFETQYVVRVGRGTIGRVDFAWPAVRVVVEADGFAFHADRDRYREDRRRTNALVLAGWRVLRFSWEDVLNRADVVVAQVRAAITG